MVKNKLTIWLGLSVVLNLLFVISATIFLMSALNAGGESLELEAICSNICMEEGGSTYFYAWLGNKTCYCYGADQEEIFAEQIY